MSRPTYMTIDLSALQHNLRCVQKLAKQSSIIAMVKANAYGHGLKLIGKALSSVHALGVASLEEGIQLREAGVTQPIVLMEGLFAFEEIFDAAKYDFTLVIHHLEHIEMLEKATNIAKPFIIWLKINTGMNRLGIDPDSFKSIFARLQSLNIVKKPIGYMTHFASADQVDSSKTLEQIFLFTKTLNGMIGPRSLANSAGIIAWQNSHADWVRPGLMLYGASPFFNYTGLDHGLKPVMTLSSRIIAISRVKKGYQVGYGGTWTAPADSLIGIVGVGYGDGYPQFAKNGTPVLVNDIRYSLAGRVSMDMLAVDLQNQEKVRIGDHVVLWGKGLPVEEVAHCSNTSAYEILTRMTPRPKIEIKGAEHELAKEISHVF